MTLEDEPIALAFFGLAVLFAIGIAVAIRRLADRASSLAVEQRREPWNLAVAAIAAELGLVYDPLETAPHRASGNVCKQSVSIGYGSGPSGDGTWMTLEVFTTNVPERLAFGGVGDPAPGEELRAAIESELPRLGIRYFRWLERELSVSFWPSLDEMVDPEATLKDTLALVQRACAS